MPAPASLSSRRKWVEAMAPSTATAVCEDDIVDSLSMAPDTVRVRTSSNRTNLHYSVRKKRGPNSDLVAIVACGIPSTICGA